MTSEMMTLLDVASYIIHPKWRQETTSLSVQDVRILLRYALVHRVINRNGGLPSRGALREIAEL